MNPGMAEFSDGVNKIHLYEDIESVGNRDPHQNPQRTRPGKRNTCVRQTSQKKIATNEEIHDKNFGEICKDERQECLSEGGGWRSF